MKKIISGKCDKSKFICESLEIALILAYPCIPCLIIPIWWLKTIMIIPTVFFIIYWIYYALLNLSRITIDESGVKRKSLGKLFMANFEWTDIKDVRYNSKMRYIFFSNMDYVYPPPNIYTLLSKRKNVIFMKINSAQYDIISTLCPITIHVDEN